MALRHVSLLLLPAVALAAVAPRSDEGAMGSAGDSALFAKPEPTDTVASAGTYGENDAGTDSGDAPAQVRPSLTSSWPSPEKTYSTRLSDSAELTRTTMATTIDDAEPTLTSTIDAAQPTSTTTTVDAEAAATTPASDSHGGQCFDCGCIRYTHTRNCDADGASASVTVSAAACKSGTISWVAGRNPQGQCLGKEEEVDASRTFYYDVATPDKYEQYTFYAYVHDGKSSGNYPAGAGACTGKGSGSSCGGTGICSVPITIAACSSDPPSGNDGVPQCVPTGRTETSWASGQRYNTGKKGSWATFAEVPAGESATFTLYAGQSTDIGSVYAESSGKYVSFTGTLFDTWLLNPEKAEQVKIQGYVDSPSGNPFPGGFACKTSGEGSSFSVSCPSTDGNGNTFTYWGIHLDVAECSWQTVTP